MATKTDKTADTSVLVVATEAGLPAELMGMMEQDAGRGLSDNPNDVGIPYIAVLADLSPQVKKRDEKYIEGAEVGTLWNTVTKELYPLGIEFIPAFYESCHVEWVPRDAGGGFRGKHPYDTPLLGQAQPNSTGKGALRLANGNDLVETRYWYGFFRPIVAEGERPAVWDVAVISLSSTGLRVSREWVGMTKRVYLPGTEKKAPLFSSVYSITTKLYNNPSGDWFLPEPKRLRWVTGEEYTNAKILADQIEAGAIKVSQPESAGDDRNGDETVL